MADSARDQGPGSRGTRSSPKFIDPTRSPLWPPWLTPFLRPLTRLLLIDRLNDCLADLGDDAAGFVSEMAAIGGAYGLDGPGFEGASARRSVVFANHPLGGADVIAALGLMESLGTPYEILATNVILPPAVMRGSVVSIDNSEIRSTNNFGELRRLVESLRLRDQNIFVFPAGHCSVFSFRRGITDIRWKHAFVRLAALSGATLVPIWFSGRNSIPFYVVGYVIGRLRSLILPLEFFRTRHGRLVYRVGRPIEPRFLPLFGDEVVEAMRASVYLLGTRPPGTGRRDMNREARGHVRPATDAGDGVSVALLSPGEVRRDKLAALRGRCGETDAWSRLDETATHLVAAQGDTYVGVCRLFGRADLARRDAAGGSTLAAAYEIGKLVRPDVEIVEFDRLVIDPSVEAAPVADRLFETLREYIGGRDGRTLCLGVLALDDCDPVLAEAQFEFARRQAPCALTAGLRPRARLIPPNRNHAFSASRIRYRRTPTAAAVSGLLRHALFAGLRFGPSARGAAPDERPCVVATIAQESAV